MENQRWLSLDGICKVLNTISNHIRWLVKNGYIEKLPGTRIQGTRFTADRYLEPTPAYAEKLRTSELIYGRRNPLPSDIDSKCIFTAYEIAAFLGWPEKYTRQYLHRKKIPHIKTGDSQTDLCLYSAKTVRQMILDKEGRKTSPHRAGFLIPELVEILRRLQAGEDFPTDAQLAEDAKLEKKLSRLLKLPADQKEAALREFWKKVQIAKDVATLL